MNRACITIQKFFRMIIAKNKKMFLKRTKFAIVVQKYARCYLAKKLKVKLKMKKASIKIQVKFFLFSLLIY